MIVRFGNAAPVYVKTHDIGCPPGCPARHSALTGYTPQLDENDEPVLNADGSEQLVPVFEDVHDGTKERVTVQLAPGEAYRVTNSDLAVPDTDEDRALWLDRAFTSIASEQGAWRDVSDAPPLWTESNWPDPERRLAAWFDCPIGEPEASDA